MGMEDEIRELILKGYAPTQVVEQGYKKSTVYKVHNSLSSALVPVTPGNWVVSWTPPSRHMPADNVTLNFSLQNTSSSDLYLYRVGAQPEWLGGSWYAIEARQVLRPGVVQSFVIRVPLPASLPFGEHDVRWGVEAQQVGPGTFVSSNPMATQWTEPFALEVKKPITGYKVFLSHSSHDLRPVRQLEAFLDNEGIKGFIAEDKADPGVDLWTKFRDEINQSDLFMAFLTENAMRSEWVINEANYALSISKPSILLKEKGVALSTNLEWVPFSRHDPPEILMRIVGDAIHSVRQRLASRKPFKIDPLGALAIGVVILLAGVAIGRAGSK